MICSYLENLLDDYLEEKLDIEKKLTGLQIRLKENIEFIKLLEENNDPNYESFTPREVHSKNKIKIEELKEEQKNILEEIELEKVLYHEAERKVDELHEVMKEAKSRSVCEKKKDEKSGNKIYGLTLLETQENERQRISRELHDSTVQGLTSLVHKTELCNKLINMDPVRCKLELTMMSKTLREIINDMRQMIFNLRPMSFDDIGLDITIERTLDKIKTEEMKNITFSVEGEPYKINPVIGITILRIIQEACNNAVKYADASLISVKLIYEENQITISIEDNGKGFNVENMETENRSDNSGFGLSMMKERVYLLSGTIDISSEVNEGTRILVHVPILDKEDN